MVETTYTLCRVTFPGCVRVIMLLMEADYLSKQQGWPLELILMSQAVPIMKKACLALLCWLSIPCSILAS